MREKTSGVCLDSLLPYKKRPASTGMVARNLVAGALGIRTNVSSEQRKKERELLKEARGISQLFFIYKTCDIHKLRYKKCANLGLQLVVL